MDKSKIPSMAEQAMNIMAFFDFDRVKKTMDALNWKWSRTNGVPDMDEIKEEAIVRLMSVINSKQKTYYSSCGGFKATKEDGVLCLEFVVTDWIGHEE